MSADERGAAAGPVELPAGLSREWPVAWRPVWGDRDGPLAAVESALVRGALEGASRLPEPLLAGLLGGLARVARAVDRRHAEAARRFLAVALGALPAPERERRVRQAYAHLFRVMVETQALARVPVDELTRHYDVRWTEEARRARDGGTGTVVVTGHLGNWEAAVALAPWIGFDPFYAVAKPPRNRPLSRLIQRDRERRGVRVLPRRGAMHDAPAVLRAGGSIGLLLDQRARVKPVLAPFFGRPARCDRSAGVLLRRLRAPVLVVACYRAGAPLTFRVEFEEVLWPEELAGAGPETIAARVNAALERLILRAPEQYFWLHDRYKDTPLEADGEEDGRGGRESLSSAAPDGAGSGGAPAEPEPAGQE